MMPTVPPLIPQPGRRSGVALILILGLIALFLLISFAFTVKTRTDHWMSRNSISAHRVQHIFIQALDQAMLEGTHYISGATNSALNSYWYYPRREYINSSDVLPGNGGPATYSDFMLPPMDAYIPSAVSPYVLSDTANMRWGIIAGSYGVDAADTNGCPNCGQNVRITATDYEPTGISYSLVNCSGYLDANFPYECNAASTTRHYGTNASEIQIYNLDTNNRMSLARSNLGGHIDTMHEFRAYLQDGDNGDGVFADAFFPFSHFVSGEYYNGTLTPPATAAFGLTNSSSAYLTANATTIKQAFENAGVTGTTVQIAGTTIPIAADTVKSWLLTNLIDYVDVDDTPQNLTQPSQEHVPGFNEIQIKGTYSCTRTAVNAYSFRLKLELGLELWNAHLFRDSTPTYAARCLATLAGPGVRFSTISGLPAGAPSPSGISLSGGTQWTPPAAAVSLAAFASNTFTIIDYTFAGVPNPAPYTQAVYTITVERLQLHDISAAASPIVDDIQRTTFICTNNLPTAGTNMIVGSAVTNSITDQLVVDMEAIDPRFNWSFTNKLCWVDARPNSSIGTTNNATITYLTNGLNITDYVAPLDDSDTYMFCQGGALKTVGDLGYLVFAPWRTIKLYSTNGIATPYHRVVDTFTQKKRGQIEKGLVNPNTAHQNVLAAVFKGLPMERYPGDTLPTNRLSWIQSQSLAEQIIRYTYNVPPGTNINPYAIATEYGIRRGLLNVSDTFGAIGDDAFLNSIGANSEFTREALVRNSSGLLNTRQILFTAFLAASDELNGGGTDDFAIRDASRSGAEKRAVAVIWSDPWKNQAEPDFPDQFIRFFRLMPNDSALAGY